MSDIPQEILTELLSRLRVKPLLRFRCVCKSWCTLIDSQEFIKLHLDHNLESDRKLFLSGDAFKTLQASDFDNIFTNDLAEFVNVDTPPRFRTLWIDAIGCCNGLVSLYGSRCNQISVIMIWNPTTRKYRELPDFGQSCVSSKFDFGYDAVNDDYKVVKIQPQMSNLQFSSFVNCHYSLEVYSLKSNTWKKIEAFSYNIYGRGWGVFAVGALHWVVSGSIISPVNVIFAFDLATEKCQLVPLPECVSGKSDMDLAVLRGHLCLLSSIERGYVDTWIVKDYGLKESWTKLASFVSSDLLSFGSLFPISFSKSGKQILLNRDGKGLVCYDLEEKSTRNINLRGTLNSYPPFTLNKYLYFCVCSESLVRLSNFVPTDAKGGKQGSASRKV